MGGHLLSQQDGWNAAAPTVLKLSDGTDRGTDGVQALRSKSAGGEGGIRTLGTGVSPYNGLAILCSYVMLRNLNHLQSRSRTKTHLM
jgi:hypothetical protein